jgi:hypothetical protein
LGIAFTPDARKARVLASTVLHRWQTEFEDMRRRRAATVHDLAKAGWEHYSSELERDAAARANLPSAEEVERERVKALEAIRVIPDDAPNSGLMAVLAASDFITAATRPSSTAKAAKY